jgi:citrate lyase subunit beta / citryl-CoA lyase
VSDGWRSLLFVPADQPARLEKAASRGADALIIDLEDAIPPDQKTAARLAIGPAITALAGADIVVRINAGWRLAMVDLEAVVVPGVKAVMLPKVEGAGRIEATAEVVAELELERGLKPGAIGLIPLIETPLALEALSQIAAAPRVMGLAFGGEDFSLALGVSPSARALTQACQQVAYTARARGLAALGVPATIGEFRDLEAWAAGIDHAKAIGMTGALCIHPAQIAAANLAFAPSLDEIAQARAIVEAWGDGALGVVALDGKMLDRPVVDRARRLLARHAPQP